MQRATLGHWSNIRTLGFVAVLGLMGGAAWGQTAPLEAGRVRAALDAQSKWLAGSSQGASWNQYLIVDQLRQQLDASNPDRSIVEKVVARYASPRPGLNLPLFTAVRTATERWLNQLPVDSAKLVGEIRAAKEKFAAPQPADAIAALDAAQRSAAQLETYLTTQGANGDAWRNFLKTSELQRQLAAEQPNLDSLAAIDKQFASGHFGLQLAPFNQVRVALDHYLRVTRALQNNEGAAQYAGDVDRLATLVEQQAAQPTPENAAEIGALLGRLKASGQSPQLVAAIRRQYARPNVFVEVADSFLARSFAEHVDESLPVREFIQGTRINGTARTVGDVTLTLVPNDEQAVLQALFAGTTYSKTVGANGPARIYSAGTTRLTGRQVLEINADGVRARTAESGADTSIRTTGIGATSGGIKGCIVEKVASKRVAQAKPNAERTASRKAETLLNARLDKRVDEFVAKANDRYWKQIRQPLTAKGQFPEDFLIRTSSDELLITGVAAGPSQLAASAPPPALTGDPELAVRLHETAINNFAQGVLAGETVKSDDVRQEMLELLGELPERFQDDEGKAPWSITFADEKPVEVRFADNSFTITIRGKQYTADEKTYRAMNVTAVYKIESRDGQLIAARQGDLQIFPPGFVPGERRFSIPEQTLRSILERRFGKFFTPEMGGNTLQPPGRLKNLGELQMSNFAAGAGWISLGWTPLAPAKTTVAKAR